MVEVQLCRADVEHGRPVSTRQPDGLGFGQHFMPIMGMGFLIGLGCFHGHRFGMAKPSRFVPIAISR